MALLVKVPRPANVATLLSEGYTLTEEGMLVSPGVGGVPRGEGVQTLCMGQGAGDGTLWVTWCPVEKDT